MDGPNLIEGLLPRNTKEAIWKFHLDRDKSFIEVPSRHKFLHIGIQNKLLYMWLLVDPSVLAKLQPFHYSILGTGTIHNGTGKYLGTVIEDKGDAWHVFQN